MPGCRNNRGSGPRESSSDCPITTKSNNVSRRKPRPTDTAGCAKVPRPGHDRERRCAGLGRARAPARALDQHRHALQHHLRQLLHRIEPLERPPRLHPRGRGAGVLRRDRRRWMAGRRDRLHRRRAVHESRLPRDAGRRASARLPGAGADQRHEAAVEHARPLGRDPRTPRREAVRPGLRRPLHAGEPRGDARAGLVEGRDQGLALARR